MGIIEPVTACAFGWRLLVALARMTAFTVRLFVGALERKLGFAMIEARLGPLFGVMAIRAHLAQAAPVRIVTLMTIVALPRGVAQLALRLVAIGALDLGVGTEKREIGDCVVKNFPVQTYDIFAASLVIRVAVFALGTLDIGPLAVKTPPAIDVGRYILVTRQAQTGLRFLAERLVAVLAFVFEFGVPFDDLTGHHQLLEHIGAAHRREKQQHANRQGQPDYRPHGNAALSPGGLIEMYGNDMGDGR